MNKKMIEQFNRILSKVGSHRLRLRDFGSELDAGFMTFEILHWGNFTLFESGLILQDFSGEGLADPYQIQTANAMWLENISRGKTRDDAGKVA